MQIHTDPAALRILLVDDDSIALELVSLLLAGKGTQVVRASGGQEALRALQVALAPPGCGPEWTTRCPASAAWTSAAT